MLNSSKYHSVIRRSSDRRILLNLIVDLSIKKDKASRRTSLAAKESIARCHHLLLRSILAILKPDHLISRAEVVHLMSKEHKNQQAESLISHDHKIILRTNKIESRDLRSPLPILLHFRLKKSWTKDRRMV